MKGVFGCAGDLSIKTYYQDTDSIHLNYDDVDKIAGRFKEEYGQELVGQNLSQFHVDLPPLFKNNEIDGIENYLLGKETYRDILESTNEERHITNANHTRMRGIPTA